MASNNNTHTTTVLRVKRPRHVEPVSLLCVDLERKRKRQRHDEQELLDGMQHLMHHSTYVSAQQQRHASSSTVTWKLMTNEVDSKENVRYVDALLGNDDGDKDEEEDDMPKTKRRRLALTLLQDSHDKSTEAAPKPSPSPKKQNIILDPLSRLVDDSLKQVFTGGVTIAQHLDFIAQDPRLSAAGALSKNQDWLAWSTQTGGTILHAAVLLDDKENTQRILSLEASSQSAVLDAVDGDGKTPLEVATSVGHDRVAELLESQLTAANNSEEDEDFVYDMFCIQDNTTSPGEASGEADETKEILDATPLAELRGGIGYWNEEGELVLEALPEKYGSDDEEENDEDVDSNCEDYAGNDYPDEQAWPDDDDDDSFGEHDNNFRNRPIDLGRMEALHAPLQHAHASDDEYYEDISAHYDLYESTAQPDRVYAYDYELDGDSDGV